MSIAQAAQAISQVFPNTTITTPQGTRLPLRRVMLAIAGVESGWNATAAGDPLDSCPTCVSPDCRGYTSYSYFQVHFYTWQSYLKQATGSTNPCDWASWLAVPLHAAQAGWALYQAAEKSFGNGLQPWWPDVAGSYAVFPRVTTAHPAYRNHLAAAEAALAQATAVSAQKAPPRKPSTAPGPRTQAKAPSASPSAAWWVVAGATALAGAAGVVGLEVDWHWATLREDAVRMAAASRL